MGGVDERICLPEYHLQVGEINNGSNEVTSSNVIMKICGNGSSCSDNKVMNLKVDHVIIKESIVVIW